MTTQQFVQDVQYSPAELPFWRNGHKPLPLEGNSAPMEEAERSRLMAWTEALEEYARDWDETFGGRPDYFTQEFWYMLIGCLRAHWAGQPLTVGQLAQTMKSGSNRTREERIKRAVDDGYLIKMRDEGDGRSAIVRPTEDLEALIVGHLTRTMATTRQALSISD